MSENGPILLKTSVDRHGALVAYPESIPDGYGHLEPMNIPVTVATPDEVKDTGYRVASLAFSKIAAWPVGTRVAPAIGPYGYDELLVMDLKIPDADKAREAVGLEPKNKYELPCARIKSASTSSVLPAVFMSGAEIARLKLSGEGQVFVKDGYYAFADEDGYVHGIGAVKSGKAIFRPCVPIKGKKCGGCEDLGIIAINDPLVPDISEEPPVIFFHKEGELVRSVPKDVHIRKAAKVVADGHWINCGVSPIGRIMIHEDYPEQEAEDLITKMAIDITTEPDLLSKEEAMKIVQKAREALKDKADYVEVVGGLGRGHDQVKDIDLLIVPKENATIEPNPALNRVEIFTSSYRDFEPQLIHWLAGKAIIHMKVKAASQGMKLTRYGLELPNGEVVTDAEKIYQILGFQMPPHVRDAIKRWRSHVRKRKSPLQELMRKPVPSRKHIKL